MLEVRSLIPTRSEEVSVSAEHAFLSVICRDDTYKCAVLRIGTLAGCPLCEESHTDVPCARKVPAVQVKELNSNLHMVTCRLSDR